MAFSRAVLATFYCMLVSMGQVSCTLFIDHQLVPRTSHSNRLPANTVDQDLVLSEAHGSASMDSDMYGRTVAEEGDDEDDDDNDNNDDDEPNFLLRLRRLGQEGSEMTSILRSYNLPSSSASQFSATSTSSRSLSPPSSSSSTLIPSSSSQPSSTSRQSSERVLGSRMNAARLAQVAEARRRARARQSELRTQSFRRTILNGLGLERAPATSINPDTRRALLNWLLQRQLDENTQPAQRVHVQRNCYLGQCTVPIGVNTSLWQDLAPLRMKLNFQLPRLNRRRGRREEVERAELSLFVKPRDGCPCLDDNGDQIPGYIVSVHQFTRRLVMRKRRVVHRTSLLESVRIPYGGNAWLRMNVTRAAQTWMARPRRNLGLEIRVKDVNGTVVDARSVLGLPDCEATESERSCVHGSGPGIEILPWPYSWHDRHLQLLQGRPYLDLRVVDRSRTTVDLARSFGPTPRRLGNLEDFFASQ